MKESLVGNIFKRTKAHLFAHFLVLLLIIIIIIPRKRLNSFVKFIDGTLIGTTTLS